VGPTGWPLRDLGITVGLFIAGLLPYVYLPLAAQADPVINFGDPNNISNFWRVVTRVSYGTFSLTAGDVQGDTLQQLVFIGRYLIQSFTPIGVGLAILGVIWFARRKRMEGIGIGLAFLFSGPLFAMYANPDFTNLLMQGIFERFYILPSIPFALFIAAGTAFVIEMTQRWFIKIRPVLKPSLVSAIGCIVLLAILGGLTIHIIMRFPSLDMSGNRFAEQYGKDLLAPLEPNALLIMSGDHNYNFIVYVQHVLKFRTDVLTLDANLMKGTWSWYLPQQRRLYPEIVIPFNRYDEGQQTSLADLIEANIGDRPVYSVGNFKEDLTEYYDLVYWGLTYRFLEKGEGSDPYVLMRQESNRFISLHYPDEVFPYTSWEYWIASDYGKLAWKIAYDRQQPEAQSDADVVEQLYRIAILNHPTNNSSYLNLGLLLWKNGGSPEEIIALWEEYLIRVPDDPQNEKIRELITELKT